MLFIWEKPANSQIGDFLPWNFVCIHGRWQNVFNEGHDPSHCGEFKSIEEGLPVDQVPN